LEFNGFRVWELGHRVWDLIDHLSYLGSKKKTIQEKKASYGLLYFRKSPYGPAVWVFTPSRYRAGGLFGFRVGGSKNLGFSS